MFGKGMPISSVITFEGSPDDLVWKSPIENFNTTSHLIVDETHEAILVVNGAAADLFGPGEHTLSVPNIPILRNIVNIPTDGVTPFPCKVFYVNKVHQLDMLWGTQGAIPLEDPLYDIFMHVMLHGSIAFSVDDTRKCLVKLVGFRGSFSPESLVAKFRGIISSEVKDAISKIMINGKLSYFNISANLYEISEVVKDRLDKVFDEYGMIVQFFNIETIEVPKEDYEAVSAAKSRRSGRIIEGYTWQEERQMIIAEKFAQNEGTMGAMGGMVGGAMGGIMMGGTIGEIARSALDTDAGPRPTPPKNTVNNPPPMGSNAGPNISDMLQRGGAPAQPQQPQAPANPNPFGGAAGGIGGVAPFDFGVAAPAAPAAPDFPQVPAPGGKVCSGCGAPLAEGAKFCSNCGTPTAKTCPGCGSPVAPGAKFCSNCGTPQT